ncbi:MAG: hypothetical protein JSV19_05800 [Phycisphaerales bacterium]|nr:MAG: hypothetical protein JSV19_05800 [Phycisphaerales bacterium]
MIGLDTSLLASEVTYVLMQRSAKVPPLRWQLRPSETAKNTLDEIDDAKLFGRAKLADTAMGAATRAMLYMWNGWLHECVAAAEPARERERWYLAGLCQRHLGQLAQAKSSFQAMEGHPIFEEMAKYAVDAISTAGASNNKTIARFKQIMEFDCAWEPIAFLDLYELARIDKLDRVGQELVRTLQCREWEILFTYCYQAATGKKLIKEPTPRFTALDRQRMLERKRAKRRRRQHDYLLDDSQKTRLQRRSSRGSASNFVPVRCPRCHYIQQVPESVCGDVTRCLKCSGYYGVPHKHTVPQAPGGRKG